MTDTEETTRPYDWILDNMLTEDQKENLDNSVNYDNEVTHILLAAIYKKLQDLDK